MVPWSDNGIFMAGILGVATISYIPFMWLSFVSLILAVIYGYTGKFIWYVDDAEKGKKRHNKNHLLRVVEGDFYYENILFILNSSSIVIVGYKGKNTT